MLTTGFPMTSIGVWQSSRSQQEIALRRKSNQLNIDIMFQPLSFRFYLGHAPNTHLGALTLARHRSIKGGGKAVSVRNQVSCGRSPRNGLADDRKKGRPFLRPPRDWVGML
ncbi:MAG: hypothetical protein M2R45_05412 [Verrucomicrobia subdivision 3 bacterium]|nr:hypothetical protein [Limisphaerales bacterium]MCS1414520.1 hypothetical protein [Limisphaerales bacterium]